MKEAILTYTATSDDANKTIETICRKKLKISAGLFTVLKKSCAILLNNSTCRSIDIVSEGDVITVNVTENESFKSVTPAEIPLDIIYEDEFITVVNKPRNMSVHQSAGNYTTTLANALIYHWQQNNEMHKFHAVNRLDKDTSGICIIAKNRFAHGAMSEFKKNYLAIVHNTFKNTQGTIDLPIKRLDDSVIKRTVSPEGKCAVTHYKVIKSENNISLIELSLETGRTHQIRVHMSAIGHPLVGDWLYGNGDSECNIASGQLLHAYKAQIKHPATGELMTFIAPLPADMNSIISLEYNSLF